MPFETNVHFPTDLHLLWDSLRKCLDTIGKLQEITPLKGWRKIKNVRKVLKSRFRSTSHQVFKGKNEHQKKQYIKQYLHQAGTLEVKVTELIAQLPVSIERENKIVVLI